MVGIGSEIEGDDVYIYLQNARLTYSLSPRQVCRQGAAGSRFVWLSVGAGREFS